MATKSKQTAATATQVEIAITPATTETASVTATAEFNREELYKTYHTKAGVIRFLGTQGWKPGAISKFLDISYQHAFNTLNRKLKKVEGEGEGEANETNEEQASE